MNNSGITYPKLTAESFIDWSNRASELCKDPIAQHSTNSFYDFIPIIDTIDIPFPSH